MTGCTWGGGGGGVIDWVFSGDNHRVIKKKKSISELRCFVCSLRCFLLFYVHFLLFFQSTGCFGGSEGFMDKVPWLNSRPKITKIKGESPRHTTYPVKSFTNVYRNLLQQYVHFFGDVNHLPTKLGTQEICIRTCTINKNPVLSLFIINIRNCKVISK